MKSAAPPQIGSNLSNPIRIFETTLMRLPANFFLGTCPAQVSNKISICENDRERVTTRNGLKCGRETTRKFNKRLRGSVCFPFRIKRTRRLNLTIAALEPAAAELCSSFLFVGAFVRLSPSSSAMDRECTQRETTSTPLHSEDGQKEKQIFFSLANILKQEISTCRRVSVGARPTCVLFANTFETFAACFPYRDLFISGHGPEATKRPLETRISPSYSWCENNAR